MINEYIVYILARLFRNNQKTRAESHLYKKKLPGKMNVLKNENQLQHLQKCTSMTLLIKLELDVAKLKITSI